jgi:cytochrome c-type biogenesis protein CcmH|tara:strand:- start:10176 stop:10649 length:474 start_codon:yes stop_codon:yes gene_type:complete
MRLRWSMGLAAALFTLVLFGSENLVEFSDESLRARYQTLITELRCPKCQNQNLADSNAPISKDLREEIQRMLEQKMSDREIKYHLTSRYSEFILYRPDVNKTTYLLWGSPFAILLIGLLAALRLNRRNKIDVGSLDETVSDQDSRIAELLKSGEDDK